MAISKPITRVEQYLAHISGMRVNVPEVPLTREEMYLAAWAKKSGIEDTEMQGDPPLTLKDCIGEPFNGLVLYGKSTQVTTTGAQLLDLSDLIGKTETKNGATYKINEDQSISVSGTPTEYTSFYLKAMSLKAGSYYFLSNPDDYKVFVQLIGAKVNMNNGFTLDEDADGIGVYVVFNVVSNNTKSFNLTFTSMLNAGDTALPWEPYTGGKPSPSPDYPQEIQSAKGEVVVHGKNLFGGRYYYAMYAKGMLLIDKSQKDKEVKFPYQPETETRGICKVLKCQKGKTYVISVTNPNKNATIGMAEYENIENAYAHTNNVGFAVMTTKTKQLYTAKSDGILVCGIAGTWTDGKTTLHECTESELLQVEEASEATSYEPYHTPQTLTLSTPNGLPGIPVSSGGNYTDENGQQWICDEVDMERGVYVQRVKKSVIGNAKWHVTNINKHEFATEALHNTNKSYFYANGLCDMYNVITSSKERYTDKKVIFGIDGYQLFVCDSDFNTVDEIGAYFLDHPLTIMYVLATPIETPLSETDIAAYRALTTYKGTTILESECYLKVKYSKLRK